MLDNLCSYFCKFGVNDLRVINMFLFIYQFYCLRIYYICTVRVTRPQRFLRQMYSTMWCAADTTKKNNVHDRPLPSVPFSPVIHINRPAKQRDYIIRFLSLHHHSFDAFLELPFAVVKLIDRILQTHFSSAA